MFMTIMVWEGFRLPFHFSFLYLTVTYHKRDHFESCHHFTSKAAECLRNPSETLLDTLLSSLLSSAFLMDSGQMRSDTPFHKPQHPLTKKSKDWSTFLSNSLPSRQQCLQEKQKNKIQHSEVISFQKELVFPWV